MAEQINAAQLEKEAEQMNVEVPANNEENNSKLSFTQVIRKMLANGGKRINGVRVKNVNFTDKDNYTMVSFTLDRPIRGNVMQEDGSYKEGITNVIFTSLYAIAGTLKEDEELGWLANALLETPKALNLIFNGATIDIVQEAVKAQTPYNNPFSSNPNPTPQVFDNDTFINHVVHFKLGKTGQTMSQTLAVKMMGF